MKVGDLLGRRGIVVPERTLHRYCAERCGSATKKDTVPLADPEPGRELQADFGRMGLVFDPVGARRRVVHALILVAVWSRHMFVWLTFSQTTADVIEGMELGWAYFGGIFPVLIPDNLSPVITKAEPTEPRINDIFLEYSQERGFLIDAARVRHPRDKARCERQVPFVRSRFFAGEDFVDLADANRRAVAWCSGGAGMRTHGTTQCRPAEAFRAAEQPLLLPVPGGTSTTRRTTPSPRSTPTTMPRCCGRFTRYPATTWSASTSRPAPIPTMVKFYFKGELIKVHPRQVPGGRSTDPADLPSERTAYAMRDIDKLVALGHEQGEAIGQYLEALLGGPLPWTKMRQAYRLLGLVKKWGPERVEAACQKALEAEAVNVNLVARMLERAKEAEEHSAGADAPKNVVAGRFSRDAAEFKAKGQAQ